MRGFGNRHPDILGEASENVFKRIIDICVLAGLIIVGPVGTATAALSATPTPLQQAQWNFVRLPNPSDPNANPESSSFTCSSKHSCLLSATDDNANLGTMVSQTSDGGHSWRWRNHVMPSQYDVQLDELSCSRGPLCLAIAESVHGVGLLDSTDGGTHFHAAAVPQVWQQNGMFVTDVACMAKSCLAIGQQRTTMPEQVGVTSIDKMSEAGTWRHLSGPDLSTNPFVHGLTCAPQQRCWAFGKYSTSILMLGLSGATPTVATAAPVPQPGAFPDLRGASCPSATTCYVLEDAGVFVTTDGSSTWRGLGLPPGPTFPKELYFLPKKLRKHSLDVFQITCPKATRCLIEGDTDTVEGVWTLSRL